MKERPILFSTPMVQAILNGTKSCTRRVVTKFNSIIGENGDWNKLDWEGKEVYTEKCASPHCRHIHKWKANLPYKDHGFGDGEYLHVPYNWAKDCTVYRIYPKWGIGDYLWVRETWATTKEWEDENHKATSEVMYKATFDDADMKLFKSMGIKWKPSIFMPRWASRITLEITNIKAERVQEICLADIQAEGIYDDRRTHNAPIQIGKFKALWDSINAKRGYSFDSNPWVWVIEFKVVS